MKKRTKSTKNSRSRNAYIYVGLDNDTRQAVELLAGTETDGNMSEWVRDLIQEEVEARRGRAQSRGRKAGSPYRL